MGGLLSKADMDRCLELTKEVVKTFTKEYTKAFLVALVKKIKADANPVEGPEERWLVKNVSPDEPLKEGWAIKQGEIRKNWKKRYFYVTPDFRMLYFEDDKACEQWKENFPKMRDARAAWKADEENADLKKEFEEAKKAMKKCTPLKDANLYSYSTYNSNENNKEHCLELYHWRKRKFYIQFENEEERKDWKPIFQTCCRKATPPINPNPVLAAAFRQAYDKTRWHNSIWGWWYWDSPEDELIAALCFDLCRRTILYDAFNKMSYTVREKCSAMVKKNIQAIVAPAWAGCCETVNKLQEKIEPELKKGLDPIFDAERDLKVKISDMISDKIGPAVGEVVDPIVQQLLIDVCAKPIHEGWLLLNGSMEELYKYFNEKIDGKGDVITKKEFQDAYRSTTWKCRYFHSWWSFTRPISDKLDEMRDELKVVGELCKGLDGYNVYYTICEQYHNIVLDGLFTWQTAITEAFEGDEMSKADFKELQLAKWKETLPKIVHDSQVVYEEQISWLLDEAIKGPFIRLIMKGVSALLEPLDDVIPDPVKQFITATGTAEDVLTQTINNILDKTVKEAVDEKKGDLQTDMDAKTFA